MKNRLVTLTARLRVVALLLSAGALIPATSIANPSPGSFAIAVLDARYSTTVSYSDQISGASETQMITGSPVPLDSELYYRSSYPIGGEATADMFSVSTSTQAIWGSSSATAQTTLTFRPLEDGDASLTFAGLAEHPFHSRGSLSLFNLTAGQDLFSYSWCGGSGEKYPCLSGDLLFPWSGNLITSLLQLSPFLLASDTYVLTMRAATFANDDAQTVSLAVSGLQPIAPIPEPSTYAMMLVGVGVVGLAVRRRRRVTA